VFLIAGESLIDLVAQDDGTYQPIAGGAPFNFARALALQGVAAGYLNPISRDVFGQLLRDALLHSGATQLAPATDRPTSLALVSTDSVGQARYSFYREAVADRQLSAEAILRADSPSIEGFHTGALALVPPDHRLALTAIEHFRARRVHCTLDINLRPQVASSQGIDAAHYREAVLEVAQRCHVVKLSDEDLRGLDPDATPESFAEKLLHSGCLIVLVTFGARGARLYTARDRLEQAAPPVRVVDSIGAGDTFFAGFMASLHRQGAWVALQHGLPSALQLQVALQHAAASAAITLERQGCRPPTWNEVLQRTITS